MRGRGSGTIIRRSLQPDPGTKRKGSSFNQNPQNYEKSLSENNPPSLLYRCNQWLKLNIQTSSSSSSSPSSSFKVRVEIFFADWIFFCFKQNRDAR